MSQKSFEESSRTRRSVRVGRRVFDVAGARELLPLVQRIVADVRECQLEFVRAERASREAEIAGKKADAWRWADRAGELSRQREAFQAELKALQIQLLDPVRGDVGFPSIVNGALAYLIARGEDQDLRFWRYRDQPRLREIPPSWFATPVNREVEPELILD